VLLVDDGMPTEGAAALARLAAEAGVGLLRLPANCGKGHAIAAGRRHLLGRVPAPQAVVVLDADGQHPTSSIPSLLAAAAEAELVIGDRLSDLGMPPLRRFTNRLTSRLLALVTGVARTVVVRPHVAMTWAFLAALPIVAPMIPVVGWSLVLFAPGLCAAAALIVNAALGFDLALQQIAPVLDRAAPRSTIELPMTRSATSQLLKKRAGEGMSRF
jgi:hypothetical protein